MDFLPNHFTLLFDPKQSEKRSATKILSEICKFENKQFQIEHKAYLFNKKSILHSLRARSFEYYLFDLFIGGLHKTKVKMAPRSKTKNTICFGESSLNNWLPPRNVRHKTFNKTAKKKKLYLRFCVVAAATRLAYTEAQGTLYSHRHANRMDASALILLIRPFATSTEVGRTERWKNEENSTLHRHTGEEPKMPASVLLSPEL